MDDNTQSILLERYLLTLQADSSAPPPPNLDPELAKMAQRLVSYSHTKARSSAKRRVWRGVMTEFETISQESIKKEQARMLETRTLPNPKSSSMPLVWIAVASLVFVLGFAITSIMNNRPSSPQYGAGIELGQSDSTNEVEPTVMAITNEAATMIMATLVTDTLPAGYIPVVTLNVPVPWGTMIREDMLIITYWESSDVPTGAFSRIEDVVGMVTTADIPGFLPLTSYLVIDGTTAMTGVPDSGYMLLAPTSVYDPDSGYMLLVPTSIYDIEGTPTPTSIFIEEGTPTFTPTALPTSTPRP